MLVAALTNSGVKNQVPHFLFKIADGDLVLVSSCEVADILLCDSLSISEAISDYGTQAFALNSPSAFLSLITCSYPHRTSKEEDFSASAWTPAPNTWSYSYHSWFSVHGCNILVS